MAALFGGATRCLTGAALIGCPRGEAGGGVKPTQPMGQLRQVSLLLGYD